MKKQILSFLFVLGLGLLTVSSTFAANETQVSVGAKVTYTLSNGVGIWTGTPTYAWSILKSDYSAAVGTGTDYTATLGTTNSNDITWSAAGTYYISVIATDGAGCKSDPFVTKITVTSAELCMAQSAGTLPGGTAVLAPSGTTTCSLVDTDPASTSSIVTGNVSSGGSETFTFDATITGATANRSYVVAYKVGGVSGIGTPTITTNSVGEGKITISINTTDYASVFNNTSGADKTVVLEVVSITDAISSWTGTNLCGTPSRNISVLKKPTLSFN